ncbi:hypothetical protein VI03_18175 [Burkholderia vietnamiensis]|nr:hypothetical protein VI03_18175 [Burkholderia vietnamiensis]
MSTTKLLVALHFLLGNPMYVHADEATFKLCMARAEAIESTAEVRDSGVSQNQYEVRYAKMAGRPLTAAENEVVILAYAAPNYSPSQLYRLAVSGCQKFMP